MQAAEQPLACPVNSYNEWDPLEEVIVGRLEHAMLPDAQIINKHTFPPSDSSIIDEILSLGGVPYPPEMIEAAQEHLDQFIHILESEGIRVRRPEVVDYEIPFRTPSWKVPCGSSATNPRDPFLVVGNEIIEAPMADRSRHFEAWAYRSLFKEYFTQGAKWVAAPKPQLTHDQYHDNFQPSKYGDEEMRYVVTEFEPTFDAADFVRCGTDIIGQKSHVTNAASGRRIPDSCFPIAQPSGHAYRYDTYASGARQDPGQPGLGRYAEAARVSERLGPFDRASARTQRIQGAATYQFVGQHECTDVGRETRDRGTAAGTNDPSVSRLGIRAHSMPVRALLPVLGIVSLRYAGRSSAGDVAVLRLESV